MTRNPKAFLAPMDDSMSDLSLSSLVSAVLDQISLSSLVSAVLDQVLSLVSAMESFCVTKQMLKCKKP
jgi:hypothetical protein